MSETREHWLAGGRVSNAARKQLIEANCRVVDVSRKPPVVLVCLRHASTSDHFYEDMAFINMGERQISVKALCLCWHFPGDGQVADSSVTETELVLSGE